MDKPVIESELLAVLQRELELEWVAELAVPIWTQTEPAAASAVAVPLPAAHAQALLRLARLGHVQGLQRAIDALVAENAEFATRAASLRDLAARFAWPDLIASLGGDLHVADGEPAS